MFIINVPIKITPLPSQATLGQSEPIFKNHSNSLYPSLSGICKNIYH